MAFPRLRMRPSNRSRVLLVMLVFPLFFIGRHYWEHRSRTLLFPEIAGELDELAEAFGQDEDRGCKRLVRNGPWVVDAYTDKGSDELHAVASEHFAVLASLPERCASEEIGPTFLATRQAIVDRTTTIGPPMWKYGLAILISMILVTILFVRLTVDG
jgi:hypothetical protein